MHVRAIVIPLATLASAALLVSCASGAGRATSAPSSGAVAGAPQASAPARGGGVSFAGRDVPLQQALAQARASGKPAMLYFTTSWCGYCRMLERETLPDARVGAHMAGFVNVAYNADGGVGRELATRYGVLGFPTLVRVDASGTKQGFYEGFDRPAEFVARIPGP